MSFFCKNKKIFQKLLIIAVVSVLGVFVFKINCAHAFSLMEIAFGGVVKVIAYIGATIQYIIGRLFWVAAGLFDISMNLSGFTTAGIVKAGWKITRDLTNLLFVLVLLFIAFTTILQLEGFGTKKILSRLIIVALLINFSLPICGVIIDAAQVTTNFFVVESVQQTSWSEMMASAANIQTVYQLEENDEKKKEYIEKTSKSGTVGMMMMTIFSILLGIIVLLAATAAIGIGAFFMIARLIIIWFLLILVPLAWFAWILPNTAGYAKQWWTAFLKWTFFAPIYTFFVWLAIKASQSGTFTTVINQETVNILEGNGLGSPVGVALVSSPILFLQFLLVIGILFGGIKVASTTGAIGAKATMDWSKGKALEIGKGFGKGIGGAVGGAGVWTAGKVVPKKVQSKAAKYGLGGVFRSPNIAKDEAKRAAIDEAEKKYKSYSDDSLMRSYNTANPQDKVAIAKNLAKRGKLEKNKKFNITEDNIKKTLEVAKKYNSHKDILKNRPDLAEIIGESPERTIEGLKGKDMENLQSIALGSYEKDEKTGKNVFRQTKAQEKVFDAVKNQITKEGGKWTGKHLSKLNENNYDAFEIVQKEIIDKEIIPKEKWEAVKEKRPDITRYISSAPNKVIYGDKEWMGNKEKSKPKISAATPTQSEFQQAKKEGYKGK